MRLAAQAKGGYYPTPPRVVDMIAGLIQTSSGSYYRNRETLRLLDPCCGDGDAAPAACPSRPTAWSFTGTGPRRRRGS